MENEKRNILYFGTDVAFYNEITREMGPDNFKVKPETTYNFVIKKDSNAFLKIFQVWKPDLIFIDFAHNDQNFREILDKVHVLKRNKNYYDIPIVGVFKDKEEIDKNIHYLTTGIIYCWIKSDDRGHILKDSHYIAFKGHYKQPEYAMALNLEMELPLQEITSISTINNESILLESNVQPTSEEGSLSITFDKFKFDPNEKQNLKYNLLNKHSNNFHFKNCLNINILNEEGTETLPKFSKTLKDTFPHEFGGNGNAPSEEKHSVFIYDTRTSQITDYIEFKTEADYKVQFFSHFEENFANIEKHLPSAIAIQLEYSDKDNISNSSSVNNSEQALESLLEYISEKLTYDPIIITYNSSYDFNELQEVYETDKLNMQKSNLTIPELKKVLEEKKSQLVMWSKKKGLEIHPTLYDDRRVSSLHLTGTLTSITEHEITFISKEQIATGSVFYLEIPERVYLTIIPSYRTLMSTTKGTHYMGFFNGITESQLERLRILVNQIIDNKTLPFEKLIEMDVSSVKKQKSG